MRKPIIKDDDLKFLVKRFKLTYMQVEVYHYLLNVFSDRTADKELYVKVVNSSYAQIAEHLKVTECRIRFVVKELIAKGLVEAISKHKKGTTFKVLRYVTCDGRSYFMREKKSAFCPYKTERKPTKNMLSVMARYSYPKSLRRSMPGEPNQLSDYGLDCKIAVKVMEEIAALYSVHYPLTDRTNYKSPFWRNVKEGVNFLERIRKNYKLDRDTVYTVIHWGLSDGFWHKQIQSWTGLLKKGSNGNLKFLNIYSQYLQKHCSAEEERNRVIAECAARINEINYNPDQEQNIKQFLAYIDKFNNTTAKTEDKIYWTSNPNKIREVGNFFVELTKMVGDWFDITAEYLESLTNQIMNGTTKLKNLHAGCFSIHSVMFQRFYTQWSEKGKEYRAWH